MPVEAPAQPPTLTRQGNTSVVVLDAAVTEAAGLSPGTPLRATVIGRQVILEAAPAALTPAADDRAARFQKAMCETAEENAELFRRLAK